MPSAPYTLEGRQYWTPELPIFVNREREDFTLPLHRHDFVEIQYVAEGRGYHYIGEERLQAAQGDLFIIPVGTGHVYRPSSRSVKDELIVYNCLFDLAVPERLVGAHALPAETLGLLTGDDRAYRRFRDADGEARGRMLALHRELLARQPGYEAVMHACLTELLVLLYRLSLADSPAVSAASLRLERAMRYIEEHCARPLTLEEVAALLPVSASHMQRLLRQATGQSFTEYVQNARIARSRELLKETDLPVYEIAGRAGYKDLKFFYELFRRKTGLSPRRYRMEHRK